jgi:hypothetical protein
MYSRGTSFATKDAMGEFCMFISQLNVLLSFWMVAIILYLTVLFECLLVLNCGRSEKRRDLPATSPASLLGGFVIHSQGHLSSQCSNVDRCKLCSYPFGAWKLEHTN